MIPISDNNPTARTPVMTYLLLLAMGAVWVFVERAGASPVAVAAAVCDYGMVPGELTHLARLGDAVPIARGMACVVDNQRINILTPLLSIFLHGSWGHLLGNALYFWIFGNNIEDVVGRIRFLVFFLVCGLAAAAAHVLSAPASILPTVGASGAISGIMGAYLVLYPRVPVRMWIFIVIVNIQAWAVLLFWFATQVLAGLPELSQVNRSVSGGVAVWAHVGGFIAGVALIRLFVNPDLLRARAALGAPTARVGI